MAELSGSMISNRQRKKAVPGGGVFIMKCADCEFNFNGICAGGARIGDEDGYFKSYGDKISLDEMNIEHLCVGFHQGLGYFFAKKK